MQYRDGYLYRFEVPSSWVDVEGSYRLRVGSGAAVKLNGARTVELKFTVTSSKRTAYIALGIAAVRAFFCRWRLGQPQFPQFLFYRPPSSADTDADGAGNGGRPLQKSAAG